MTKRWTVMRKKTGTTVASFVTREQARNRKRTTKNSVILDNKNAMVVR